MGGNGGRYTHEPFELALFDTDSIRGSERSPIIDAIGCALLRAIGREGIELSRFEDEDELQPMNGAAAEAEDDDAVMVGPMIDKAFFSQLATNARTITDTNWVRFIFPLLFKNEIS